jgi:hypothetical protein
VTSSSIATLAAGLFGFDQQPSQSQSGMAAAIGEAMLRDIIGQYRNATAKFGPGVLAVRIHNRKDITRWARVDDIRRNLALAEEHDDRPMVDIQRRMLEQLGSIDPETQALLLLMDSTNGAPICKVFVLSADESPALLRQRLEELSK